VTVGFDECGDVFFALQLLVNRLSRVREGHPDDFFCGESLVALGTGRVDCVLNLSFTGNNIFFQRDVVTSRESEGEGTEGQGAEQDLDSGPLLGCEPWADAVASVSQVVRVVHCFGKLEVKSGDLVASEMRGKSYVDNLASFTGRPLGMMVNVVAELAHVLDEHVCLLK